MNIERIPVKNLQNNPNNPRVIKDEKYRKLVNSIKEAPWMLDIRPIVINDDLVVLGGNMRLKACMEAGLVEVPVVKVSQLTKEQQREFIIKDNLGYGDWDWDALANDWDQGQLEEWGLDLPGFESEGSLEGTDIFKEQKYLISIDCISELEQRKLFEELEKRGFSCEMKA